MDWDAIQQHYDWLGHMIEALVMAGIVAAMFMLFFQRRIAILMGISFAAGHFHGREKRDYEVGIHMPTPHLDGYAMWHWSFDQATDFWPTALAMLCLAIFVYRRSGLGRESSAGHRDPRGYE